MSQVRIKSESFGCPHAVAEEEAEDLKPVITPEGNVLSVNAFQINEEKSVERQHQLIETLCAFEPGDNSTQTHIS